MVRGKLKLMHKVKQSEEAEAPLSTPPRKLPVRRLLPGRMLRLPSSKAAQVES